MEAILFSLLAIVIALGGLWYHDVRHPPEEQAKERARQQAALPDGTADQAQEQLVAAPLTRPEHSASLPRRTDETDEDDRCVDRTPRLLRAPHG